MAAYEGNDILTVERVDLFTILTPARMAMLAGSTMSNFLVETFFFVENFEGNLKHTNTKLRLTAAPCIYGELN